MIPGSARNWIAVKCSSTIHPQQTKYDNSTLKKSVGPVTAGLVSFFIAIVIASLALSPAARAVSPPPDGGYPNGNTAEGALALQSLTTGGGNTASGQQTLASTTTGSNNTATGFRALLFNTIGGDNTACGYLALARNTADYNTASGSQALFLNSTGFENVASGYQSLYNNTTGYYNTATGTVALYSNTTGYDNTATGTFALLNNTTNTSTGAIGHDNTATGTFALRNNTTGDDNTANGVSALFSNTTGVANTATGINALFRNNSTYNTADGYRALYNNLSGYNNTANGAFALWTNSAGIYNTANGYQALLQSTGSSNVGLGYNAGYQLTTGSGNVCIGAGVAGVAGESNTTRIRNVYSSVASGRAVYVNSDGKIGTLASSRRFKDEIKRMDKASEAILALKPVTFRYKKEIEPNGAIMFGLVAEEVAKVDPDLVTRDDKGEVETVRYDAVNAMLLNEFLKEHETVQELKSVAVKQEGMIARQEKQIEALTAGLQKVSAQLELSKSTTQTVLSSR